MGIMRLYSIILLFLLAVALVGVQDEEKEVHTQGCPEGCQKCTKAIEKGLRYLVSKQKKNGRWSMQWTSRPSQIVETALCGLAFLSEGSTTTKGRYKDQIRRAVDFLKSRIKRGGRIGGKILET
jgi:hypothetical protein